MNKTLSKLTILTAFLVSISLTSCGQKKGKGGNLSVDEFEQKISQMPTAQLVDVRTAEEFNEGHIRNAVNMDINSGSFNQGIKSLDKSKPVFVYCLSGGRSASAAQALRSNGFEEVYEMPGIMAWRNAGKELVTGESAPAAAGTGLTLEEYNKKVTSDKYVLVDFSAAWCKPCKQLAPILDKISKDKSDKLILLKIDADENQQLVQQKGIEGIPYLELYKDGKLVWSYKGFIDEAGILKETKL